MGRFQHWAKITRLLLGLAVESHWLALGGLFSLLLCMNELRKQSSGNVGLSFLAVKLFSQSVIAIIGQVQ